MEIIQLCPAPIREAIAATRQAIEAEVAPASAHEERAHLESALPLALGAEAAEVIGSLTESRELALALVVKAALAHSGLSEETLAAIAGPEALAGAHALLRLGDLGLARNWSPAQGLDSKQAEVVRKMLLAVVSDPRLVLARLAEQLVRLRHARDLHDEERERLAIESRAIFAPLANRLGVWQLKWELEDLSFRYLDADEYKRIASALNERRADRERYIDDLCAELREHLRKAAVTAEVYGRPKHIFSIYRKMQRKHLEFDQLYDVRAVRVVVASVPDCYAALGVVHGTWPYIPGEFDDYIATPKGNFYRSIHTAVIGPQGKSVEVQIRTREMHEHAELGVAAHWTYKEGGPRDAQYERKIEWVRKLLEPHDGVPATDGESASDDDRDFIESMRTELFEDRVYALTPKGEVVDLPRGATPLDFAYNVHTSLGHRCRGAKVNGRIVPLTYSLSNGEIVEIITAKQEGPSRDWMAPEQGYLVSARNRSKVRAWFRRLDVTDNRAAGRAIAERELLKAGLKSEQMPALTRDLELRDTDHLYQLLGEGEITVTQLLNAAERVLGPKREDTPIRPLRTRIRRKGGSPVEIEGVGDLPITLARCCAPLRPQPITGYVTLGRGVTIHRNDCPSLIRMRSVKPERVLKVDWTSGDEGALTVEIAVTAYDRRGLLRDVTDVVALERLSIESMNTRTDPETAIAYLSVNLAVNDLEQLGRVLRRLAAVPNVIHARRAH
ncbi:MAG TPA: bifunctional (p)ppGpp synthetase/guanosine-3',5'-bis(diphosphate) 3'-pyrophosphohydrolase [Steroidobacteraceae bacterium]